MPELRKDPISARWVVVSTERGRRPSDFADATSATETKEEKNCPFCEGSEGKTPPEIIAWNTYWRKRSGLPHVCPAERRSNRPQEAPFSCLNPRHQGGVARR